MLGVSSVSLIFLSRSYITSVGLVELTHVDSSFFPSTFFVTLVFFSSILSFEIKLLALKFCYFFAFLPVSLSRELVSKINPD